MVSIKRKTIFLKCRNCGKSVIPNKNNKDGYCSPECRNVYTRCTTCGRYFILLKQKTKEETDKNKKGFEKVTCSEECKIIYIIHKK